MKITAPWILAGVAAAALAAAAALPDRPARVASVDVAKAFVALDEQREWVPCVQMLASARCDQEKLEIERRVRRDIGSRHDALVAEEAQRFENILLPPYFGQQA